MKKFQFIACYFLLTIASFSQTEHNTVFAEFTGGFSVMTFSNDPLVAPKRQNKITFADEITTNAYFRFPFKNPSASILAGLGYAERNCSMNKTNLADFFIVVFSFGNPARDSFKVQTVELNTKYISIPFAFSYKLTKNIRSGVQFYTGFQLNNAVLVGKKANIVFDQTYIIPTNAERKATEDSYTSTTAGFTFSVQPRLDMHIRVYRKAGILLGLCPFVFYINSWNKTIASNHLSFCSTMGLYYKF